MKKKQWKKQDLNLRSSSLKSSAIPTELPSLVTDYWNILLYLLIHHQTKHMKSNNLPQNLHLCKIPSPKLSFLPESRIHLLFPTF